MSVLLIHWLCHFIIFFLEHFYVFEKHVIYSKQLLLSWFLVICILHLFELKKKAEFE